MNDLYILSDLLSSLCCMYCTSVCPKKKDPSSLVLPEVSYFPSLGFLKFFLTWFKSLRAEDVTSLQCVKISQLDFMQIEILGCIKKI